MLICQSDNKFSTHGIWFIKIDSHIIKLNQNSDFRRNIKLLYQIFYIFNIKYDKSLMKFWNFLEVYIFNIKNINALGSVQQFAKQIFKKN